MRYYRVALFWLFPLWASAQVVDSAAFVNLSDAILRLQTSELMRHGTLGVSLTTRDNGEQLIGLNSDKALPPASTLKLVTTATALEVLGESYRFETYLEYDGTISRGILKGNVYISGTGDPTTGSPRFKDKTDSATIFSAWKAALTAAGIREIHGRILADPTAFDGLGIEDSWMWGDVANGYGAGIYGLNWNENLYRLYFKTGAKPGASTILLRSEPELPGVNYHNLVTTGPAGSGDKSLIRPSSTGKHLVIDGTIPKVRNEYSIKGAVFNPAILLADQFTRHLQSNDFIVTGTSAVWEPGNPSQPRKRLLTWNSPPLSEICKQTNWWSINLYADAMTKTVGKKLTGQTDFKTVAPAITAYWALKGVNVSGMQLRDGSGLASTALLTPQSLTEILNAAAKFKSFGTFYETIAIAGESGTVRNKRFGNTNKVRAKSGSIEGTRAYAGYIETRSGQKLSFAINANRYLSDSANAVTRELMEIVRLMGEL